MHVGTYYNNDISLVSKNDQRHFGKLTQHTRFQWQSSTNFFTYELDVLSYIWNKSLFL